MTGHYCKLLVFRSGGEAIERRVNGEAPELSLAVSAHQCDGGRSLVVDLDDLRVLRAHQNAALIKR